MNHVLNTNTEACDQNQNQNTAEYRQNTINIEKYEELLEKYNEYCGILMNTNEYNQYKKQRNTHFIAFHWGRQSLQTVENSANLCACLLKDNLVQPFHPHLPSTAKHSSC